PTDRGARHPEDGTDHGRRIAPTRPRDSRRSSAPLLLPLVREPPFFDEVLGQLQPHHQLADLGASQRELALVGITPGLEPARPLLEEDRFQLSSSWAGTWLSRDTASSPSPRRSRKTNSDFRWMLQRSGSSASLGAREGSGGVADFLGFVPMSGLLGHAHPSHLRVPRNRVRFNRPYTLLRYQYWDGDAGRDRYVREYVPRSELVGVRRWIRRA